MPIQQNDTEQSPHHVVLVQPVPHKLWRESRRSHGIIQGRLPEMGGGHMPVRHRQEEHLGHKTAPRFGHNVKVVTVHDPKAPGIVEGCGRRGPNGWAGGGWRGRMWAGGRAACMRTGEAAVSEVGDRKTCTVRTTLIPEAAQTGLVHPIRGSTDGISVFTGRSGGHNALASRRSVRHSAGRCAGGTIRTNGMETCRALSGAAAAEIPFISPKGAFAGA